jgi:hypothetical protein
MQGKKLAQFFNQWLPHGTTHAPTMNQHKVLACAYRFYMDIIRCHVH